MKSVKTSYWGGPAIRWLVQRASILLVLKPGLPLKIPQKTILVSCQKRLKGGRPLFVIGLFTGSTDNFCFGVSER